MHLDREICDRRIVPLAADRKKDRLFDVSRAADREVPALIGRMDQHFARSVLTQSDERLVVQRLALLEHAQRPPVAAVAHANCADAAFAELH